MSKNKTAKEKRPWHILIWLILYLANLLAALAFQYFFIHASDRPDTDGTRSVKKPAAGRPLFRCHTHPCGRLHEGSGNPGA